MSAQKRLRSRIARAAPDRIFVHGHDLADLIGRVSLGDMAWLELKGRPPSRPESAVFNAITVALVEHGLTPSALAARLTYLGSPEALQAAVAAGLLGMGSRYGGTVEDVARMLQEAAGDARKAEEIVAGRKLVPGIGHPQHKGEDPRVKRLFEVAEENGFKGRYTDLMAAIAEAAGRKRGRPLPVNATGAIGAIASELEIDWRICRGLALMARAIGLVAHLQEEIDEPLATSIWERAQAEAEG